VFWMNLSGEGIVVGANYQIQSYCGSSFPRPPRPNESDGGQVAAIGLEAGRSYLGNNLPVISNGNLTLKQNFKKKERPLFRINSFLF
jgi:hypothetical protein